MLWAALLPNASQPANLPSTDTLAGLATWSLQFTPRVAIVELSAVLLELEASARLFGGKRRLAERVWTESRELGVAAHSWAPTALGALALARSGIPNGTAKPLADLLDALPLSAITAVQVHAAILARLGCRTIGDVRKLPRGGIARRFDKELLAALDQAYGLRPESFAWATLPEVFHGRLELMARVELAPALLFGARRLLLQMCGWLAARRAGVTGFTLRWCHDTMRAKSAGTGDELTVRTAQPTRNIEHLSRLLAENLAQAKLAAPAGDLELVAVDVVPMEEQSAALLPDTRQAGESLAWVLERIAARLGPDQVLRPALKEDHRLEWMVHWQPTPQVQPRKPARQSDLPQPTFLLSTPLKLAAKGSRPMYQGMLHMLSGPHRVEGGWWHRMAPAEGAASHTVVRDYWVALSEHAGVLWVFQTRLANDQTAWFLHGVFA